MEVMEVHNLQEKSPFPSLGSDILELVVSRKLCSLPSQSLAHSHQPTGPPFSLLPVPRDVAFCPGAASLAPSSPQAHGAASWLSFTSRGPVSAWLGGSGVDGQLFLAPSLSPIGLGSLVSSAAAPVKPGLSRNPPQGCLSQLGLVLAGGPSLSGHSQAY